MICWDSTVFYAWTFVWRLSVWRLSRTSGLSQEQRGLGRPKLAHVTSDSDTTFKVKRSSPGRFAHCVLARQAAAGVGARTCWPWETAATLPSARRRKVLRRYGGGGGAGPYRGGRPHTACYVYHSTNAIYLVTNRPVTGVTRPINENLI